MNKKIYLAIAFIVIIAGGFFVWQKVDLKNKIGQPSILSTTSSTTIPSVEKSELFGTMLAFNINDAVMGTPNAIQKGWTEFKKDNSAYQNLKSNLEKIIQERIKLVKAADFSFDREIVGYFTWNIIEPQKGQFNWELTDLYAQAASDASVKISAVVQPFASWDQENTLPLGNCNALDFSYYDYRAGPPNDIAEYQNFLTKTVERYKNKVVVWEIGNEVEGNCGGYKNNPQGYVTLLKISYEAIKRADPRAMVVNGGALEFSEIRSFWQQFFALGGGQYIDYFNLHYNTGRNPGAKSDPSSFLENLAFFNDLMEKNGGKKPLYLTEFGISSGSLSSQADQPVSVNDKCGDGICDDFEKANPNACLKDCQISIPESVQGEDSQAISYFKDSIIAFANGVNLIFIDLIGNDNDVIGSSMAFNTNGQPRLFLTTLKNITSKISGFSKVKKIDNGQYKFTIGDKSIYALWSGTLPNEISGKVKVTDMKGQEKFINVAGVELRSDRPVFIEL